MKRFPIMCGIVIALAMLTLNISPMANMANAESIPGVIPGERLINGNEDSIQVSGTAAVKNRIVFPVGKSEYFLNDKTPGVKMDAATFVENDRTYVPVRFLANSLGIADEHIKWDGASQIVTLEADNLTVKLTVGTKGVDVNGSVRTTDVAPVLKNGRTYLPARFVAEALGFKVDWVDDTGMVLVYWPGDVPPNDNVVYEYYNNKTSSSQTSPTSGNSIRVDTPRDLGGGDNTTKPTGPPLGPDTVVH